MPEAKIGIIGGTGLYKMNSMTELEEAKISTPFGEPSDAILLGKLAGVEVAFLPRHGKGHRISPSELPVKANIYALKSLGVERIISVNTVGSLREEIKPLDLVIPEQLIDHTKGRESTYFTNGVVGHIAFAEPFCPVLSQSIFETAVKLGAKVHKGGTYLAMEGPQFSTKAESKLYRSWGADIVWMTALPEAKLAREAEICYASIAVVTDYDCWHPGYESITPEMILANLEKGVDTVKKILELVIASLPRKRDCGCATALKHAIITAPKYIPRKAREDLALLIGKYLNEKKDVS